MDNKTNKISCDDFRTLRSSLGLTLNEGAAVLGISIDTMRIYEGKKKRKKNMGPHPIAVKYFQAIQSDPGFIPPDWPDRLLEQ